MSLFMSKVPSSAPRVIEPDKGDSRRFQLHSGQNRRIAPITKPQADPLFNLSDFCILERPPLERNGTNRSERDERGILSKLPLIGKRKEPLSPLEDFLGDSSETSCSLRPRKVARFSHAMKKVASSTQIPLESPLETSSSSVNLTHVQPCESLEVTGVQGAPSRRTFTNPFEAFLTPTKCVN
jgi:hypothetical protein